MLNNLFQLVGNGKIECFSSTHISGAGVEPFDMVYIEVPHVEELSAFVGSLQGFLAGSKILKEGGVISVIRRTATKAQNNSDSGKKDFQS